jgi:hypothetical protein
MSKDIVQVGPLFRGSITSPARYFAAIDRLDFDPPQNSQKNDTRTPVELKTRGRDLQSGDVWVMQATLSPLALIIVAADVAMQDGQRPRCKAQ